MEKRTYSEKLKDPRWQKKRLEILERDDWMCRRCQDKENTLHVHHMRYFPGKEPWECESNLLITLCENCHEYETETRKEHESDFLEILKNNGFMSDDIYGLACGFLLSKSDYPPDVTSSIIQSALTYNPLWEMICNEYFRLCGEGNIKKGEK